MDVVKPFAALMLLVLFSACSPVKTFSDVIDEDSPRLSNKPCSGESIDSKYIIQWEDGRIESVQWPDYESFKRDFVLPNLEKIRRVEHDQLVKLSEPVTPEAGASYDDPDWGQRMIETEAVWSQGVTGKNIVVGIVDTWVDYTHPQLKNQFRVNSGEIPSNGIDDDGNGYIDDYFGYPFYSDPPEKPKTIPDHGSHVSGVIVADPNQGKIKGLAYDAKIISAPFLNSSGSGSIDDAIKAFEYLKNRGVRVINSSWGGGGCSQILASKIQDLGQNGILVVVAAGNNGRDVGLYPESPASLNGTNQLTVAGATYFNFLAGWSNFNRSIVHLAAPGERILSTVPLAVNSSGTEYLSGTSMATPFVTGAAALLWSARPKATVAEVKQALLSSVDTKTDFPVLSHGRLNIKKALTEIQRLVP